MAFGNPYGDEWNDEIVIRHAQELVRRGVQILALSDTTGTGTPENISSLYSQISRNFPTIELGVHLHSRPDNWREKIDAAYQQGCRRFDSAIMGYGGCPMASDVLTGNIATEQLISYLTEQNAALDINQHALNEAIAYAAKIFH
jgi:hydroxymethylglutaryl-CoA lyase